MTRISLTIDRIVVNGLPAGREKQLIASLRTQLTELLAQREGRSDWAHTHRTPVLKVGRIPLQIGEAGARQLGITIARRIGRGLQA